MMKTLTTLTAAALLLAAPASAHTVLDQAEAPAKSLYTGVFRVMDGCGASPTKRVTITMPEGVTRVTPRFKPGWQVTRTMRKLDQPFELHGQKVTETIASVTWTGGPLPSDQYDQFEVRMSLPDAAGSTLYFTTVQECENGTNRWEQVPKEGQSPWSLEYPAPFVRLTAPAARPAR